MPPRPLGLNAGVGSSSPFLLFTFRGFFPEPTLRETHKSRAFVNYLTLTSRYRDNYETITRQFRDIYER
jgi:hypothetical protein